MEQQQRALIIAEGPITVTYRREDDLWFCLALQFDIVGTGPTRQAAFGELRELLNTYIEAVLNTKGKVSFFNPSEAEEWENPDRENYEVTAILEPRPDIPEVTGRITLEEMRTHYRDSIQSFDLSPPLAA